MLEDEEKNEIIFNKKKNREYAQWMEQNNKQKETVMRSSVTELVS